MNNITACRICGNEKLIKVLDLGEQELTGVFPSTTDLRLTTGPLRLVKCHGELELHCGLLQLEGRFEPVEMYGENYGYRSGLNPSMVSHLAAKVERILNRVVLRPGDLVLDIGSNDGTTLAFYPQGAAELVGIDPTAEKFADHYRADIHAIPDFFSGSLFATHFPGRKARVITSFSMFYDLDEPLAFMNEVESILADDGIWVFEQSYMPTMLARNAYDTVCHEHAEYYGLGPIHWMAKRAGLVITDLEFNTVNGGSFSITCTPARSGGVQTSSVDLVMERERALGLDRLAPYEEFAERVEGHRGALRAFVKGHRAAGRRVGALGASTKGNVLLQYCGLGPEDIEAVGEVNPEKFGRFTPGTHIPIVPEDELLAAGLDYLLVLPWHFRDFFEQKVAPRTSSRLVYPLPEISLGAPPA